MDSIVPITILATLLGFAFARALRSVRVASTDQPGSEPGVTLAVFPGRTAVVTVDAEAERSPGAADLVDQAIHDAFAFDGVDRVEVRSADGELIECRPRRTVGQTMERPPG